MSPWKSINQTRQFHINPAGHEPYSAEHVRIHRRIARVGDLSAILSVTLAMLFLSYFLFIAFFGSTGSSRGIKIPFLIVLAIAIPPLFFFYGTSVALLFTPSDFLRGPIGVKWLKLAGMQNISAVRLVCFILLIVPIILTAVVIYFLPELS